MYIGHRRWAHRSDGCQMEGASNLLGGEVRLSYVDSDPGFQHALVCQARGSTKRTSRIHDNQCFNFKKRYKRVMSYHRVHMRSSLKEREGAETGTENGRAEGEDKGKEKGAEREAETSPCGQWWQKRKRWEIGKAHLL